MIQKFRSISLLALILICISCTDQAASSLQDRPVRRSMDDYPFRYKLAKPDQRTKLPSELREVSALSSEKKDVLVMVQDEKGRIYRFNLAKNKVTSSHKFEQKGDYEGVEMVGEMAYALQSDGDIFEIQDYTSEDCVVKKYETKLRTKNDTEGLGFDPVSNSLLILCKSSPNLEDQKLYKGNRAIYAFDLETKTLREKPFILVNLDTLKKRLHDKALMSISKSLIEPMMGDVTFKPSAVAVHPTSGHIYIIASVGKLLLIYNRENKLLHLEKLHPKYFNHPEGMCFGPGGTLYISNEGDAGVATVLTFKMW